MHSASFMLVVLFLYRMVNFIISNAPGTTYLSDNDGNSVLHIAAERGHEVLVECLMDTHNFGLIVGARYVLLRQVFN